MYNVRYDESTYRGCAKEVLKEEQKSGKKNEDHGW